MRRSLVTLACALSVASVVARAQSSGIYRAVDADGVLHLSDIRHDERFELVMRLEDPRTPAAPARIVNGPPFSDLVARFAKEYSLEPELLHAVIAVESAYRPQAVSPKGAIGLMQVMPFTGRRYGVTNLAEPEANMQAGSAYLRDLLAMFGGDKSLALAAYNAGENAVLRHGRKIPPFAETQNYVPKVLARYRALRGEVK